MKNMLSNQCVRFIFHNSYVILELVPIKLILREGTVADAKAAQTGRR